MFWIDGVGTLILLSCLYCLCGLLFYDSGCFGFAYLFALGLLIQVLRLIRFSMLVVLFGVMSEVDYAGLFILCIDCVFSVLNLTIVLFDI